MRTFAQYLNDLNNKKFVGLFLTAESQAAMQAWCHTQGFDLTKSYSKQDQKPEDFDFHLTVYFTTNEHDTKPGTTQCEPIKLDLDHFELLGVDKNIPVIKIKPGKQLLSIRNTFTKMGYQDAWPEYRPHISLSYEYNGSPDIAKLSLPDFDVYADKIVIKDQ